MYIAPETNIRLLKGVPLDDTYDHTIYFTSLSNQVSYFMGLTKYNLTNYSYQRVRRGYSRVGIKAELLYDCNYMMFQNSSFGNKWFFAFIKSVEYINNETSEIEFEIDPMQTWFFDYELEQCWVDREHSSSDALWGNLIPENLELGDYVIGQDEFENFSSMYVAMLRSQDSDGQPATGRTIGGVYTALGVTGGIPASDSTTLNGYIAGYVNAGKEDAIRHIYQYPTWLGDATASRPSFKQHNMAYNTTTVDGYHPKNKKLFSYPYNFLIVSNNEGQTAEYKWEQWNSMQTVGKFGIAGTYIPSVQIFLYPMNYRKKEYDFDSGMTLSNFPECAWVGDYYQQWIAQNKSSVVTGIVGNAITGLTNAGNNAPSSVMEAAGRSILNTGVQIANAVAKIEDIKRVPPQVHGQAQTESLNTGMGRVGYTFQQMCLKAPFARMVDDYFSMFGYKTNAIKVPNRNVRPHWCYTKTIGCCIKGTTGLPCDDARKICSIYDAGITFWKSGSEVGNYSLDNTVQ